MDPRQRWLREQVERRRMEREEYQLRVAKGERPWEESTGMAGVLDAVRDQMFPKGADELAAGAGDRLVQVAPGRTMALAEILDLLGGEAFYASLPAFEEALREHWPAIAGGTVSAPAAGR